jgi:hypothetical protein
MIVFVLFPRVCVPSRLRCAALCFSSGVSALLYALALSKTGTARLLNSRVIQ